MKRIGLVIAALCGILAPSGAWADSEGAAAPGTGAPRSTLTGCLYNSAGVTLTNGQQAAVQCGSGGALLTATTPTAPVHYISAASTNSTNVKASAGQLFVIAVYNNTATIEYLKLYDKATAPTCGTDIPTMTVLVPASTSGSGLNFEATNGIQFLNGIGFCITGGIADSDTTATTAAGQVVNFTYR